MFLKLLLFFVIPVSVKWLILSFLGFTLLVSLSNTDIPSFFAYLSSSLFSYFFALIIWKTRGPFPILEKFEKKFVFRIKKKKKKKQTFHESKIYDFKTGEPLLDDDDFLDAMLTRIDLYGEEILTKKEKKRMQEISKKKNFQK